MGQDRDFFTSLAAYLVGSSETLSKLAPPMETSGEGRNGTLIHPGMFGA